MAKETLFEMYFPDEELTWYGFKSHMESFMRQLLTDPKTADVDDFLKSHDITKKKALELLLYKPDPKNERSAVMMCIKRIHPEDLSEEDLAAGKTPRDNFSVTYKLPREGYKKKMRNVYINNFESNIINEDYDYERMLSATPPLFKGTNEKVVSQCKLGSIGDRWAQYVNQNENNYKPSVFANQDEMVDDILKMDKDNAYKTRGGMKKLKECDCGSCLGTGSSLSDGTPGENPNAGRYDTKLGTVRRTIHITEEQLKYIQEATAGDIGTGGQTGIAYPFSGVKPNDPTMNHKNIMKDAMPK